MKKKLFLAGMFLCALGLAVTGCSDPSNPDPSPTTYSVSYSGNGSDGGAVPVDSTAYTSRQMATVRGNTGSLTKSGKDFDGWNTKEDGSGTWYLPNDRITMASNVTLYAFWQNPLVGNQRRFTAMRLTDDIWYSLTAEKVGDSTHCEVWADVTTGITATDGQAVANQYESAIYNQITGAFGGIEDVDGNGKVIFLMLDIIDGLTGPSYVGGYFQGYQMYSRSAGAIYSNEADMLYMDTTPGFSPGNQQNFYSTMAHELQHLIEFSQTVAKGRAEKDLWINEGLSTGAEYIYGNGSGPAQQTSRINYFNAMGTSIPYGNNFFVWDGYWEKPENGGDVLADYATAYLFFQWLQIHANNRTGIYKDIIDSSYGDYRAVTGPASSKIHSSLSNWGTLLSKWLLANYVKSATGLLGYEGEINTTTYRFPAGYSPWPLSPGEGVFSPITGGTFTASPSYLSPNIKYIGTDSSGNLDESGPSYSGLYLLTFNANSNNQGNDENGKLTASIVSGPQASVQMSLNGTAPAPSAPLPASYPIDVHFRPDGTVSPDSPRAGTDRPRISPKPAGVGQ